MKILDIIPKPGDRALFVKEDGWLLIIFCYHPGKWCLYQMTGYWLIGDNCIPGEGEFVMYNNVPVNVC